MGPQKYMATTCHEEIVKVKTFWSLVHCLWGWKTENAFFTYSYRATTSHSVWTSGSNNVLKAGDEIESSFQAFGKTFIYRRRCNWFRMDVWRGPGEERIWPSSIIDEAQEYTRKRETAAEIRCIRQPPIRRRLCLERLQRRPELCLSNIRIPYYQGNGFDSGDWMILSRNSMIEVM